jgi:hypothetical protein
MKDLIFVLLTKADAAVRFHMESYATREPQAVVPNQLEERAACHKTGT